MAGSDSDLFSRSLLAAVVIGFGGGAVLTVVGLLGMTNWRGLTTRYAELMQGLVPRPRRGDTNEEFSRELARQRFILGMTAALGVLLLLGGLISVIRHVR